MLDDRALLLLSMALQGAVSLTFGLAFLGLWRGFQRPMALWWASAWLVYAVGVVFAGLGIGLRFGAGWPPVGLALLALPLQLGVMLFRAVTDSLTEPSASRARRYVTAAVAIFVIVVTVRQIEAWGVTPLPTAIGPFILPRLLMGVSYAWVAWPLRRVARRRWAEGVGLMAIALVGLSLRMFAAVGFEVWQIAHGARNHPENPVLTIAQVCLLIVFGVATALVLVEAERRDAVQAAHTMQTTADALRASEHERHGAEDALRETEERMRFALERSNVGVWEHQGGSDRLFWSDTLTRMHGLTPATYGGRLTDFLACVQPTERASVAKSLADAVAAGDRELTVEYHTKWPDGTEHGLSTTAHYTYSPAGTLVRGAGVTVDVTTQRSLEARLRQAEKMEAVGRLAGGIAHDYNNMLNVILGYGELVLNELPAGDRHRADLEEMMHAARRSAALTHQLLAFGRKQVLFPRVLRLAEVVHGVAPMLGRLVGESIDLRTTARDDGRVRVDAGQIEQVIVNLVINARDAMPHGGRLTIDTADTIVDAAFEQPHLRPGTYVTLAVSDTGVGMDAETRRRAFEPFFTTKDAGLGTGLGLASAYGVVAQSGGHITVASEMGHGTTFTVYLPRVENVVGEQRESGPPMAAVRGGSETILLVEDEPGVREFANRALKLLGYRVHAYADSAQALAFAADESSGVIHAVVSDVVLPGISGPAMVSRLKRTRHDLRVLYVSGYASEAISMRVAEDADVGFLPKPFTAHEIGGRVRDVLDAPRINAPGAPTAAVRG
jgi:signal transduction histidine kinase/CheY-like chemotaxis protein